MAKTIEEAFERRFCTTNNSSQINLYDSNLFLLTASVDLWYRLDCFPTNLKQKVVRLLKSGVKSHSCTETGQVPLVLPSKPKAQLPKNNITNFLLLFNSTLNWKQVQILTKVSNKIQMIKSLRQKLSFFWLKKV